VTELILIEEDIRVAMLSALLDARQCRSDGWPDVPTVIRHARAHSVPADLLGSYFGLLRVKGGRWVDVFRGMHPLIAGPPAVGEDVPSGYAFFRGFSRAMGRPVPALFT
jgi:hypothetical protein